MLTVCTYGLTDLKLDINRILYHFLAQSFIVAFSVEIGSLPYSLVPRLLLLNVNISHVHVCIVRGWG